LNVISPQNSALNAKAAPPWTWATTLSGLTIQPGSSAITSRFSPIFFSLSVSSAIAAV
jgi:hypothetical protein